MKKEYVFEFLLEFLLAAGGITTAFAIYLAIVNGDAGYLSIIEYATMAVIIGNLLCAIIRKIKNTKNCI